MPIEDQIRKLAEELAATEDEDVRDSADILCREYRRRVAVIDALTQVEKMAGGTAPREGRLREPREELRDRLQSLLAWAKRTRRL